MHGYAQLLSKLLSLPQNGGGVWGGEEKLKCDELFH